MYDPDRPRLVDVPTGGQTLAGRLPPELQDWVYFDEIIARLDLARARRWYARVTSPEVFVVAYDRAVAAAVGE